MKDFTKTVQQFKAIEYLMSHNVLFRSIAFRMSTATPSEAAWIAAEYGTTLRDKIENIAPQMDVSEKEKREGYQLAPNPSGPDLSNTVLEGLGRYFERIQQ
jgi:hypothetical protein